jgi:hypothetical protein
MLNLSDCLLRPGVNGGIPIDTGGNNVTLVNDTNLPIKVEVGGGSLISPSWGDTHEFAQTINGYRLQTNTYLIPPGKDLFIPGPGSLKIVP